jgi:two-component system LytT family sensor kinase
MQSLFASDSRYNKAYWLIWVILAVLYATLLKIFLGFPWYMAGVDAIAFTGLFALMGIAVWYVVKFSALDSASVLNTVITHLAAAAILVFTIVAGTVSLLGFIFSDRSEFYTLSSPYHIYRLIIGGLIYAFLAINFYLIFYYEEYRSRKIRQIEMDKHLKSAELNMLKSQINPHFIFNSLNSVSSLTLTAPEKAHDMVIQLADFLRYSIRKNADQLVTLEKEIEAMELFLTIERTRYGQRLQVDINCDEKSKTALLPVLILQPLVENAIKYSLHETDTESNIKIDCDLINDELQVEISNNYDKTAITNEGEGI